MTSKVQSEKKQQANLLAQMHFEIEDGITQIFRINQSPQVETAPTKPVALLEVNTNTISSGIMPIEFGPDLTSGFKYPSVIVEITPDEYQKIRKKELKLPTGWAIGDEIIRRPVKASK